jgi:Mrp family chromosome partitioning ATPase
MSSTSESKPVFKQSRASKAAIIRPVNRRDGKTSFVRIDTAEEVARPIARALQLEDYVAQIQRAAQQVDQAEVAKAEKEAARMPKSLRKKQKTRVTVKVEPKTAVVNDTARQQHVASSELTQAEHVDVLRAVAKLDAGYQWIANNNRNAATELADIGTSLEEAETPQLAQPETNSEPVSQDLVNNIAAAIASVLTNVPESQLNRKIESGLPEIERATEVPKPHVVVSHPIEKEENLKLSPEIPRPEYTLPVSEHNFVAKKKPKPSSHIPKATKTVSLSAAAWDVPAFRWPSVTDQILAAQGSLSDLAENCESMLSPFGKTIAVTAPTRGQGTTTMSITLARLFAASGKRVLLIDGDIMQPVLSKTIGLSGVSWYRSSCSLEPVGECIIHGKKSGVCVMPLDGPVSNVAAHSEPIFDQLDSHIDMVRGEFDLIVIDAGPVWQIVDEISHDSHLVDVAMLVNQDTHSNGFSEARERLMDRGIFKFIAAQNSYARKAA